ncbi:MAG: DUF6470 family protein [Bacillota bacterium]
MIEKLNLHIDNYPSQKAMGFYKTADSAQKFAEKGMKTAQKAASFYASTGDKLSDFKNYKISNLASEIMSNPKKEIVITYKPGPKIDFRA